MAVLTGAAARGSADPAARRTWWLLTAALGVYSIGNLLNSTYWLFGVDPFPSIGDVFFLGFYPLVFAAVLTVIRAAAVRVQWARLGLDTAILMLGFGAFFWFFVIAPTAAAQRDPDVLKYVLAQTYIALNCLMLLACGVLLMHSRRHADPAPRTGAAHARLLVDVPGRHRLGHVEGRRQLHSGRRLGRHLPVLLRLARGRRARAAARHARRAPRPERVQRRARSQGMPYIAMMVSFLVLVYVESSTAASPVNTMTVIIFVLTSLVMVRQGVLSRDDALLRERRAAGHRRGPLRVPDQERLRRDHDHRRRGHAAVRLAGRRAHLCDPPGRPGRAQPPRSAGSMATASGWPHSSPRWPRRRGRVVGPIELVVETGERRSTLECVGSNLMDDPAIAGLALNFRDVSERKALEEQLRKLAFHDPLTLLANRSLFWNRVEHALTLAQRSQQRVAVMFLDLDNFKNVNDSLGHDAGDRLLQAAAQRLVKSTRPSDTVARLGGDEFAILLEGIRSETDVERIAVADHRRRSTGRCCSTAGKPTPRPASAWPARSPATTPSSCCATPTSPCTTPRPPARRAACCSSRTCRNSCTTACAWSRTSTWRLQRNEFFVEFQPVVDLTSRELLGVEALVRWNHPQRGIVMPGAFISIAEESGRIVELGRRVLVDACTPGPRVERFRRRPATACAWRSTSPGRHLQQGDLVADVRHALEVSGLDPGNLVIELTESTIMQNTEVNLERFRELKALGVRLAIDDFGMGYSSLSYLHRFPIDILKIDRAFVSRLTEQDGGPELARAVVMLGDDARPRDGRRRHRERGPGGDPAGPRLRRGPGIPVCQFEPARCRGADTVHGTPRRPAGGGARCTGRPHRDRSLPRSGTLAAFGGRVT